MYHVVALPCLSVGMPLQPSLRCLLQAWSVVPDGRWLHAIIALSLPAVVGSTMLDIMLRVLALIAPTVAGATDAFLERCRNSGAGTANVNTLRLGMLAFAYARYGGV